MYDTNDLDPAYEYLPLVAVERKVKDARGNEVIETVYRRTYPAYPWKMDGQDRKDLNAEFFIDICADKGVVHWETAEQRKERLKAWNTQSEK